MVRHVFLGERGCVFNKGVVSLTEELYLLTKEHKYINICLSRCLFCSFVLLSKNFDLLSKDKVVLSKDLCSFVKIKSLHFKDYKLT